MSHKENSTATAVAQTSITDVTDFDWNSVEISVDGSLLAVSLMIQNLSIRNDPAKKNYRDFRNIPYQEFINFSGPRGSLHWTDKEGDILVLSDKDSWHILLKRFVQQGGNPPYNRINLWR